MSAPVRAGGHRRLFPVTRKGYLLLAAAGLALLVVCGFIVRNGTVSPAERRVFRTINDLPDWLYEPVWIFQQFGALLVALVLVLAVALLLRRPRLALAAVAVVILKLALERVVKQVVERRRPGTSIGDVVLRGDVSASGLSFVSGHAVLTTAMAVVLTPYLPRRWRPVPWIIVVLNGLVRVYVGAHTPLDVVGGAGLGLFIGGIVDAALLPQRPADDTAEDPDDRTA